MLSLLKTIRNGKKPFQIFILSVVALLQIQPALAQGPPAPSIFSNPLALMLLILMIVLMIVIAILGKILLGTADWKFGKREKKFPELTAVITIMALLLSPALFAQDAATTDKAQTAASIGGLSAFTFYVMVSVIFMELFIILAMLVNIRLMIKKEALKKNVIELATAPVIKKPVFTWWNKINKFKPLEQESTIDLGHDYDGIRELDNRLPPWWLWGFYITIVMAGVYLWRYHVAETAPLSKQEYEESVQIADAKIQAYLKLKGESVDENTVTYLNDKEDLLAGQRVYQASCVACHKPEGGGDVGPNLTDDYWLHGGDLKSIFKTIKYGVDGKGMAAWQSIYSPKEIAQASFVKSLKGTNPPNPKAPQGILYEEDEQPATIPVIDSTLQQNEKKVAVN